MVLIQGIFDTTTMLTSRNLKSIPFRLFKDSIITRTHLLQKLPRVIIPKNTYTWHSKNQLLINLYELKLLLNQTKKCMFFSLLFHVVDFYRGFHDGTF